MRHRGCGVGRGAVPRCGFLLGAAVPGGGTEAQLRVVGHRAQTEPGVRGVRAPGAVLWAQARRGGRPAMCRVCQCRCWVGEPCCRASDRSAGVPQPSPHHTRCCLSSEITPLNRAIPFGRGWL